MNEERAERIFQLIIEGERWDKVKKAAATGLAAAALCTGAACSADEAPSKGEPFMGNKQVQQKVERYRNRAQQNRDLRDYGKKTGIFKTTRKGNVETTKGNMTGKQYQEFLLRKQKKK